MEFTWSNQLLVLQTQDFGCNLHPNRFNLSVDATLTSCCLLLQCLSWGQILATSLDLYRPKSSAAEIQSRLTLTLQLQILPWMKFTRFLVDLCCHQTLICGCTSPRGWSEPKPSAQSLVSPTSAAWRTEQLLHKSSRPQRSKCLKLKASVPHRSGSEQIDGECPVFVTVGVWHERNWLRHYARPCVTRSRCDRLMPPTPQDPDGGVENG